SHRRHRLHQAGLLGTALRDGRTLVAARGPRVSRVSQDPAKTDCEQCFSCGDHVPLGGLWHGAVDVAVCPNCAEKCFHLGLDGLLEGFWGHRDPEAFRLYFEQLVMRTYWKKRTL